MRINNGGMVLSGTGLYVADVRLITHEAMALGPHSATVRGEYTIPAGHTAMIVGVVFHWRRNTAATTVGTVRQYVTITLPGRTEEIVGELCNFTNEITNFTRLSADYNVPLPTGTRIRYNTHDTSTGGSGDYYGRVVVVLYSVTR